MKFMMSLIFACVSFTPAVHAESDDELAAALDVIRGRTEIMQRGYLQNARLDGRILVYGGLVIAGIPAFLGRSPTMGSSRMMVNFGRTSFVIGGVLMIAGVLGPYAVAPTRGDDPKYFKATEDLQYFFGMPLARQHRVASRDPELRQFVLDLAQAYRFVESGTPGTQLAVPVDSSQP